MIFALYLYTEEIYTYIIHTETWIIIKSTYHHHLLVEKIPRLFQYRVFFLQKKYNYVNMATAEKTVQGKNNAFKRFGKYIKQI